MELKALLLEAQSGRSDLIHSVEIQINSDPDWRFQLLERLPPQQFRLLVADIRERGVLVPIEIDEEGQILDGHHRYSACVEIGIDPKDIPTIIRTGMTELEKRSHARSLNAMRRQLSRKQRRALIEQELTDNPTQSNNAIAKRLGVSDVTVAKVRTELGLDNVDRIGEDGKLYEYRAADDEHTMWWNEWKGMPDFEMEDITSLTSIRVHFADLEALHEFAELVGQRLTLKTKSIWYPDEDLGELSGRLRYA